ncbi:MAG TPA: PAS domain-containing protein, partial [Candidatus Obscuribacterales bacterium]
MAGTDHFSLGLFGFAIATPLGLALTLLISLWARHLSSRRIADQVRRASENQFRLLIDEMHVGVLLLDAQATILAHNQAVTHLLNLSPRDLTGQVFGVNW